MTKTKMAVPSSSVMVFELIMKRCVMRRGVTCDV